MIRALRVFTTVLMLAAGLMVLEGEPAHQRRPLFLVVLIGSFIILLTDIIGILKRPKVKQPSSEGNNHPSK